TSEFSRGLPPAGVGIRRFSGQVWMYHSAQKLKERFILYHFASFAVPQFRCNYLKEIELQKYLEYPTKTSR
ncbi:MAG TPA: hypothetical protein VK797_27305, partial [Tepidisphaeraceae bacterium]|nr:hypothetical protein [Tepidisphaeraceae bacterium]